jgi:beta-glucosidase
MRRLFIFACIVLFTSCTQVRDAAHHETTNPVPRTGWWLDRFQMVNDRVRHAPDAELIFIGDSITQRWEWPNGGAAVWQTYYAPRNALNLGFGGDRTQNVLWRLQHGNIDGLRPKVAVLMIGTNNARHNTPQQTADGIIAICKILRKQLPSTKILLLAIFPRGQMPDELRQKNALASELASKIADDKMIHYLDIGSAFLQPDGSISDKTMFGYIHPTPAGYQLWAEAMEPKLAELLSEN